MAAVLLYLYFYVAQRAYSCLFAQDSVPSFKVGQRSYSICIFMQGSGLILVFLCRTAYRLFVKGRSIVSLNCVPSLTLLHRCGFQSEVRQGYLLLCLIGMSKSGHKLLLIADGITIRSLVEYVTRDLKLNLDQLKVRRLPYLTVFSQLCFVSFSVSF